MAAEPSELLSRSQAARELGVASETVAQWVRHGKLRYFATPMGRLVYRADIEHLKAERAAKPQRGEGPWRP